MSSPSVRLTSHPVCHLSDALTHKNVNNEKFIYLFHWCDLSKSISTFPFVLWYFRFGTCVRAYCASATVCTLYRRLTIAQRTHVYYIVRTLCVRTYAQKFIIDCRCNLITFNNKLNIYIYIGTEKRAHGIPNGARWSPDRRQLADAQDGKRKRLRQHQRKPFKKTFTRGS